MARILIVDDDPALRRMAAVIVGSKGHEVLLAQDGEEGLAKAIRQRPDLIVSDVLMPRLNGFQLVEALRAQEELVGVPVLLVTSMAERAQVRAGMAAGADDYLTKPYGAEDLLAAVDAALRKSDLRERAAAERASRLAQEALAVERERIEDDFEDRFRRTVQQRWESAAGARSRRAVGPALLVAVRVFVDWPPPAADEEEAGELARACERIRDVLYLYGASQVVFGAQFAVGVFDAGEGAAARVARAVDLLHAGAPDMPLVAHAGDAGVVRIGDAMHGDAPFELPMGPGVRQAIAALGKMEARGWPVGCTPAFAAQMGKAADADAAEPLVAWHKQLVGAAGAGGDARQVHDGEDFERRYGKSTQLAGVVWRVFAAHVPGLVEELDRAVQAGEQEEVHRLAHTLKSNAAMVSAVRLQALAADLEASAGGGDEAGQWPDAVQRIRAALLQFLAIAPL